MPENGSSYLNSKLRRFGEPGLSRITTASQLGRDLREARLGRGEEAAPIAATLRLRVAHLEALEAGDLAQLPARPYALGYLRSYAAYLGLDPDVCAARLKGELDRAEPRPCAAPIAPAERRHRTPAVTLLSLLVVGALYGGYFFLRGGQPDRAETVPAVPGELGRLAADALERPSSPAAPAHARRAAISPIEERAAATVASPTPQPAPADAEIVQAAAATPSAAAAAAAAAPAPDPAQANAAPASPLLAALRADGSVGPGPASPIPSTGLVLLATEASWVQVRSAAGDFVRTRTLQAGEQLALPARDDLALWTGNAGGVQLVDAGANLGAVGGRGQVVRNLALGREQLRGRRAPR